MSELLKIKSNSVLISITSHYFRGKRIGHTSGPRVTPRSPLESLCSARNQTESTIGKSNFLPLNYISGSNFTLLLPIEFNTYI